jgi:hypothetical protein
VDPSRFLDIRRPIDQLEEELVRRAMNLDGELSPALLDGLRYVLSFARLSVVRATDGTDVDVAAALAPHRWRVLEALRPHLEASGNDLWAPVRELPELVAATRAARKRLLEHFELDRDSLEAEVTTRQLVCVAGGGGGSGYGYAGAYTQMHRWGLQPELLAGTSMGALISMFRARRRIFDGAPMFAAARRLTWNRVFRILEMDSRYGLPATLRLYLRSALGSLFVTADGRHTTFNDLEIPLLVITTGLRVDALKHDLDWYEHFLDDTVRPGMVLQMGRLRRLARVVTIVREFLSSPEALAEVAFGADPFTREADVLDAAGFSCAVPGIIHYDVMREDKRTRHLLDQLYGEYGITRLTEGGVVNNVPARPAFAEVMKGRIGRRNPFVLAMDCFAPKPSQLGWFGLQQVVRPNVRANLPYANLYFVLDRRLSPMNLVPSVSQVTKALKWTAEEIEPHLDFVVEMCRPLAVLSDDDGNHA